MICRHIPDHGLSWPISGLAGPFRQVDEAQTPEPAQRRHRRCWISFPPGNQQRAISVGLPFRLNANPERPAEETMTGVQLPGGRL